MSNIAIKNDEVYVIIKGNLFIYKNNKFKLIPKINKKSWITVVANNTTVFAINSIGNLYVWGSNTSELFTTKLPYSNMDIPYNKPILINRIDNAKWISINVGVRNAGAINENNDLFMWSNDIYGELGEGTIIPSVDRQIKINNKINNTKTINITKVDRVNGKKWISVSLGNNHTCAINEDGQLYAWGLGENFILGNKITTYITLDLNNKIIDDKTIIVETGRKKLSTKGYPPVEIPKQDDSIWVQVIAGNNYTYAFNKLGDLYSWGSSNRKNTLGLDNSLYEAKISKVPIINNKWVKISCYNNNILGLTSNGDLYGWGEGKLPYTNNTKVLITKNIVDIAAGLQLNCALNNNFKKGYFIWGEILYDSISKTVKPPSVNRFTNTIEHFNEVCADFIGSCNQKYYYLISIIIVIIMIIIIYNNQ